MGRRFRGRQEPVAEQVRGWADPQIFRLVELVERLDVSGIEACYRSDGVGGVPYDPRLMLVTVLWCYRHQVRGAGQIARACREQVSLRVVWQRDRVPSEAAVRRFIARPGWQQVFTSLLAECDRAGLVQVSLTATDSTPVAVSAALPKVASAARITVLIEDTERDLAAVRARLAALADDADIVGFVETGCGPLRRAEQLLLIRLDRLRQAESVARQRAASRQENTRQASVDLWQARVDKHRAELDTITGDQQQKVAGYQAKTAAGRKPRGPAPRPPEDHPTIRAKQNALHRAQARLAAAGEHARDGPATAKISPTDPTALILKGKNTVRWVLGRLLTLTVAGNQLILAGLLSPHTNDYPGLFANLAATATNCTQAGITSPFGYHLADAGFASPHALTQPAPIDGTLLICVSNEHHQTRDQPATPAAAHRHDMAKRLSIPDNQTRYRRRTPMIEPVFAHLLRTDRHLHTRGPTQHNEILALATSYNAGKYLTLTRPHNTRQRN
jgi:hypothetical protein